MPFMNLNGPILANTVYRDNKLVAKDVEFTLPEVTAMVAEVEATGPMSFPVWARVEDMVAEIVKIGLDKGFKRMITPNLKTFEFRFPQRIMDENGKQKTVPCKAFLKCRANAIPGISVVPGEATSNTIPVSVTRYQLFVNNEEYLLIDKIAGIVTINGEDYTGTANGYL